MMRRTEPKLWDAALGNGVVAAPMTYEIDGKQYVSIAAGWGGVFGQTQRATDHESAGIVYTFAIGGDAKYPDVARYKLGPLIQGVKYDPKDAPAGAALYFSNCLFCHGVPGVDKGGNIPNLAYVDAATIDNLGAAVFGKAFAEGGMPDFNGKLKAGGCRKAQGVHPGNGRRGPSEVGEAPPIAGLPPRQGRDVTKVGRRSAGAAGCLGAIPSRFAKAPTGLTLLTNVSSASTRRCGTGGRRARSRASSCDCR